MIYCNDLALLNGRIEEVKIGWSSICTNMSAKQKYKPYKEEIESVIKRVQKIMKTEYDTTFQFKLIGSANQDTIRH